MKTTFLKSIFYYAYLVITTALLTILNCLWVSNSVSNAEMLSYYSSVNYDMTLTVENRKQDAYYMIDEDYFLLKNFDGSFSGYVKSTSLMLADSAYSGMGYYRKENVIDGAYRVLKEDECSITQNIAAKSNLKIGDKIYSYAKKSIYEYTVVSILRDTYNFLNPKATSFEPYIFSGCNKEKVGEVRYLSFAKINDETDKNASDHCFVRQIIKSAKSTLIKDIGISMSLFLLFVSAYFVLNRKDVLNMIRLYNLGWNSLKLFSHLLDQGLITFMILLAIGFLPALFTQCLLYFAIECGIICLFITLTNVVKLFWRLR